MTAARFVPYNTGEVKAAVLTAQAVTKGDLVALSAGNVVRAEDEAWDTDLATTQANFVAKFLGASRQNKTAGVARVPGNGTDNIIRVSTSCVVEYDCASASFAVGALVGPAKQSGNALESQKVVSVAYERLAVGRVFEATSSANRVKVHLLSSAKPEGRQDNTGNDSVATIVTLTDSTGLSGTHDDTLAATAALVTLTDSTGLSGTHDDTLAATTVPGSLTVTDGTGTNDGTIGAITDNASTIAAVQELAAKINAMLTLLSVMTQNTSDIGQKVIEVVAQMAVTNQNVSDVAQKQIEVVAALKTAGIVASS